MKDMNRRSFIGFGVSAFASAGVLSLFALDDKQQCRADINTTQKF